MVERGFGDQVALIAMPPAAPTRNSPTGPTASPSAGRGLWLKPGNRVLVRSATIRRWSPAGWPLQGGRRGGQHHADAARRRIGQIVDKAEIALALCDTRLMDELCLCEKNSRFLKKVIDSTAPANHDAEIDRHRAQQAGAF